MAHKTDWFHDKKWGMFIHLLDGVQNNPGRAANMGKGKTDWSGYIDSLDADFIASQIAEVNAGYLCLTIMQRSKYMLAPNTTYDRITGYKPGEACAKRDFIEDIYSALNKRGIDLLLYFTGDGPLDDPQAGGSFGYVSQNDKVSAEFVSKWAGVVEEYSKKYGAKVRGWWADGCYAFIGYDEEKLKIMADALRAGNRDALVALNLGVEKRVSAYSVSDDFTTGEMNDFTDLPDSRFIGGAQWHTLSFLGVPPDGNIYNGWCQPGTKYTGAYMRDYITKVNGRGGVVTVDVCMFRDGHIDEDQMNVLRALRDIR
ncbi:MAG: hypothetical protein FWD23_09350 [Oscillospiraceae bacterium]|nr:hypothetical protein [Oscillospiraceae bacterium]